MMHSHYTDPENNKENNKEQPLDLLPTYQLNHWQANRLIARRIAVESLEKVANITDGFYIIRGTNYIRIYDNYILEDKQTNKTYQIEPASISLYRLCDIPKIIRERCLDMRVFSPAGAMPAHENPQVAYVSFFKFVKA